MPYDFLVWLLAVLTQAAVLGVSLHSLMQFTDLESDNTNPHDAAANINAVVGAEAALQAAVLVWLLVNGKWMSVLIPIGMLGWYFQQYRHRRHKVDVMEIYREVGPRKKEYLCRTIAHLIMFVICLYHLVYVILNKLLTPEGRVAAQKMFQEAAASVH